MRTASPAWRNPPEDTRPRVLVVENDHEMATVLRDALVRAGFDVAGEASGEASRLRGARRYLEKPVRLVVFVKASS